MNLNKFEIVDDYFRKYPNMDIKLPQRATKGSAGYDIFLPCDLSILPGEFKMVKTDIKARINPNEVLMLYVRSSVGIKKNIVLMNGTGIIDSDYYNNPETGGNICLALWNYGSLQQDFKAGDRICQGIFMKYSVTNDDDTTEERTGGIGSTNDKENIKIIKKDLLESDAGIIAHQVNIEGIMGAGVALAIKNKYKKAFDKYHMLCVSDVWKKQSKNLLGYCQSVACEGKTVVNMFAESLNVNIEGNRKTDYDALRSCFKKLNKQYSGQKVAIPYQIGCGLGGGDWNYVFNIIKEECTDIELEICSIEDL